MGMSKDELVEIKLKYLQERLILFSYVKYNYLNNYLFAKSDKDLLNS